MRPATHSLGKNGSGSTVFVKTLTDGSLQLIHIGAAARAEINLSAEQGQALKDILK